jgi:hypothetical protein
MVTIFSAAVLSNQITNESHYNLLGIIVCGLGQDINQDRNALLFSEKGSDAYEGIK